MDEYGFKVIKQQGHLLLYRYGVFKCSGDNEQEIEEAINEILEYK